MPPAARSHGGSPPSLPSGQTALSLWLGTPKALLTKTQARGSYLVMSQLEGKLHKSIWARLAFLDQPFTKSVECKRMEIHIIGQKVCAVQGSLYNLLTLEKRRQRFCLVGGSHDTHSKGNHKLTFSVANGAAAWKCTRHVSFSALPRKVIFIREQPLEEQWGAPSRQDTGGTLGLPGCRWDSKGHFQQLLVFFYKIHCCYTLTIKEPVLKNK